MDNPLEQPAPDDPIARVHEFARDLAWGVALGMWETGFRVLRSIGDEGWMSLSPQNEHHENFKQFLQDKWNNKLPGSDLLKSFGFLELDAERFDQYSPAYLLTLRAFALLEKPPRPPEVFISYRHAESSAFALLIEARLKNKDPDISVFIDKAIQKGEDWEERIKKAVETSGVFICLLGPDFAESDMMSMEIDWAEQSGSRPDCDIAQQLQQRRKLPCKSQEKTMDQGSGRKCRRIRSRRWKTSKRAGVFDALAPRAREERDEQRPLL